MKTLRMLADEKTGWFVHRLADEIEDEALSERNAAYNEGFDDGFVSADDWLAQHEDAMAEHGWVRLPLDADGVPIHVGDVMEFSRYEIERPVRCEVAGVGQGVFFAWAEEDGGRYTQIDADAYRHYHEPTVADVLCELLDKVDDDRAGQDAIIAEYAAKLRLAGDAE